jgi:hypothetical protein
VSAACSVAVRAQVSFITFRQMMMTAAVELAANPSDKLLAKYVAHAKLRGCSSPRLSPWRQCQAPALQHIQRSVD